MNAQATRTFRDAKANIIRNKGERFECSPARMSALEAAGVAISLDVQEETKPAPKKANKGQETTNEE